jgi:hypothetical protein
MQGELLAKLGKGDSLTNQRRYMSLCALHGMFLYLFRQPLDARNFALFWEVNKRSFLDIVYFNTLMKRFTRSFPSFLSKAAPGGGRQISWKLTVEQCSRD